MKNKLTDLPIELQHKITKYIPSTKQSYNKQIHKLSQPNYVYIITENISNFDEDSTLHTKVFSKFKDAVLYLFTIIKTNHILMGVIKDQIEDKLHLNQNEVDLFIQNLNFETLFLLSDDELDDRSFSVYKQKNKLIIAAISVSIYEYI